MDTPMHFPWLKVPVPDLDANSVVFSDSEEGFWSNDDGWVADLRCASVFCSSETSRFDLPISASDDARWITLREAMAMGAS